MNGHFLSQRRRNLLERWALLNLALLLSAAMGLITLPQDEEAGAVLREQFWRLLPLTGLMVCAPVNGIYLIGSAHLYFTSQWREHRYLWLFLLALGVLWMFVFQRAFMMQCA